MKPAEIKKNQPVVIKQQADFHSVTSLRAATAAAAAAGFGDNSKVCLCSRIYHVSFLILTFSKAKISDRTPSGNLVCYYIPQKPP